MDNNELFEKVLDSFTVRHSTRARRASLYLRHTGLEVVLPQAVPVDHATQVLRKNREWLGRAVDRMAPQLRPYFCEPHFPAELCLRAIGQQFNLRLAPCHRRAAVRVNRNTVLAHGSLEQPKALERALLGWLRQVGHMHLVPRCRLLAERNGLSVGAVRIGTPARRWGSCSARGTIMLNARLLFLPPRLCDAVICHELAHLVVFDHSAAFQEFFEQLFPGARQHRAAMAEACGYLPGWAAMK